MKKMLLFVVGLIVLGATILGVLRYNYNKDLVQIVDDYYAYNGEVARFDIDDSHILLYYYTEEPEIKFG